MENKYEYYVTSNYGIDIKDIEYDLDRNTWRDSNVNNKIVPHRIVEKTDKIPGSKRNTVYLLTLEEAKKLRKDPRVLGVTKKLSPEEDYTSNELQISGSFGDSPIQDYMLSQDILYHSLPDSFTPQDKANLFESNSFSDTYSYSLTGKNVDLVVIDTNIGFNPFHADLFNHETGKSRFNLTEWVNPSSSITIGSTEYTSSSPDLYTAEAVGGAAHGLQTLSKAGGTIFGVAKNANLHFINGGVSATSNVINGKVYSIKGIDRFTVLKNYHNNKLNNKYLGSKSPTVVVQSQTSRTNLGAWCLSGSYVSESFNFPNCDNLQGIRINYLNKDYCIISSSGTTDILDEDINGVTEVGNYYFYSSSNFTGLRDKINNTTELSDLFSCSISGNEISLTSSIEIKWYMKVYTGSIYQFSGSGEDIQTPFGGNFAVELTGSAPPRFNIDGWYPGGTLTDTPIKGNPPRLEYGWPEMKNFDHFGVDNGWNIPTDPTQVAPSDDTPDANVDFQNYDPSVDAEIEAMTDAGVIYIVSAGNRGIALSRSGSNDNPYFTGSLYNKFVWDSYFISQRDTYPYADPGEPTYYLRSYPSTPAYISVGSHLTQNRITGFSPVGTSNIFGIDPYIKTNTNVGAGVDIYAHIGGIAAFSSNEDFYTPASSDWFTEIVTTADSASLSASLEAFRSGAFFDSTFDVDFSTGSRNYGGTSCAAPVVGGVVCLFMEKNPKANLIDVRNFLYENSQPAFIYTTGSTAVTQSDFRFLNSSQVLTHSNGLPYYDQVSIAGTASLYGGTNRSLHNPFGEKEFSMNSGKGNGVIRNCRLTSRF